MRSAAGICDSAPRCSSRFNDNVFATHQIKIAYNLALRHLWSGSYDVLLPVDWARSVHECPVELSKDLQLTTIYYFERYVKLVKNA